MNAQRRGHRFESSLGSKLKREKEKVIGSIKGVPPPF
jgi:hypothetical protein